MQWRRRSLLATGRFVSLGPCGQELGTTLPDAYDTCWNARRESFRQTPLYTAFRQRIATPAGADRRHDPHENRQLSWSYVLARRSSSATTPANQPVGLVASTVTTLTARYVGTYRRPSASEQAAPYAASPDDASATRSSEWRDYLKLCPAHTESPIVAFERRPGFEVPRLRYGDELARRDDQRFQRQVRAAGVDPAKSLAHFDFAAVPALNRTLVLDLATGSFVTHAQNVLLCGPPGPPPARRPARRAC